MKALLVSLLLFLAMASQAQTAKPQFEVLQSWQCGKVVCLVLVDPNKEILFGVADKQGLIELWFKGVSVWKRLTV